MKSRKEEVLKLFLMEVKEITSNTERNKTGMGKENIKAFPWVHYGLQNQLNTCELFHFPILS